MARFEPRTEVAIARTRADVARFHKGLSRSGTAGASSAVVSARVPEADLFVITPDDPQRADSGPETMVVVDLDGVVVSNIPGSESAPARGVGVHADLYRFGTAIGGLAHVASPYASAFALRSEPLPCLTITIAEEFGGDVPVIPHDIDDAGLARRLHAELADGHRRAVLVARHGAYTAGLDLRDALRAAVALEEAARIVQLGRDGLAPGVRVDPLPADLVDALHARRRRDDARRVDRSAPLGAFPTSRTGSPGSSGGAGSWTTPPPNGSVTDNDVRNSQ
ncbi:class II aldolase/adducin family protein [Salinibacterium sp. ZJ70]|uniref:class II aldolase/adducin family protein n=1 Tax=Salinibacterium sp. ZJ70 TaxID=2708084 RepID=UPI001421441F|nr:class II aldolase/adducin family protein [Salinibacterium sp. ZJ70]